jgi:3-phenylpropionate/trans-cinnamate dioxygenase ferredoxin component
MTEFVCSTDEIPHNGNKAFDVGGLSILICNTAKGWFAVENLCSHAAERLEGGIIKGPYLFCPAHSARFDLRDGTTNGALTKCAISTYPLTLEAGGVYIEQPLT